KRVPRAEGQNGPCFPRLIGWFSMAMLLLVVSAIPAHAQYGASLQGTVEDTTGAVVPGASLTLADKETGHSVSVVSGDNGQFTFNELAPSKYSISISRDGFKKKLIDNVEIIAEQANSLTIKLEVGTTAETVTVSAGETAVLDTE